jgi:hypothetical protein
MNDFHVIVLMTVKHLGSAVFMLQRQFMLRFAISAKASGLQVQSPPFINGY